MQLYIKNTHPVERHLQGVLDRGPDGYRIWKSLRNFHIGHTAYLLDNNYKPNAAGAFNDDFVGERAKRASLVEDEHTSPDTTMNGAGAAGKLQPEGTLGPTGEECSAGGLRCGIAWNSADMRETVDEHSVREHDERVLACLRWVGILLGF